MIRARTELEYQCYLSLREQANEDWQRLARICTLVAKQWPVGDVAGTKPPR